MEKHFFVTYLIKKLFPCGVGLDGEFKLSVDSGDADVHGLGHDGVLKCNATLRLKFDLLMAASGIMIKFCSLS